MDSISHTQANAFYMYIHFIREHKCIHKNVWYIHTNGEVYILLQCCILATSGRRRHTPDVPQAQ